MKCDAGNRAFDCVKWPRSTCDRITAEIRDVSHEELRRCFEIWRPASPLLAELFDRRKAPAGGRDPAQAANGRSAAIHP